MATLPEDVKKLAHQLLLGNLHEDQISTLQDLLYTQPEVALDILNQVQKAIEVPPYGLSSEQWSEIDASMAPWLESKGHGKAAGSFSLSGFLKKFFKRKERKPQQAAVTETAEPQPEAEPQDSTPPAEVEEPTVGKKGRARPSLVYLWFSFALVLMVFMAWSLRDFKFSKLWLWAKTKPSQPVVAKPSQPASPQARAQPERALPAPQQSPLPMDLPPLTPQASGENGRILGSGSDENGWALPSH